jgi:hypothetical protein
MRALGARSPAARCSPRLDRPSAGGWAGIVKAPSANQTERARRSRVARSQRSGRGLQELAPRRYVREERSLTSIGGLPTTCGIVGRHGEKPRPRPAPRRPRPRRVARDQREGRETDAMLGSASPTAEASGRCRIQRSSNFRAILLWRGARAEHRVPRRDIPSPSSETRDRRRSSTSATTTRVARRRRARSRRAPSPRSTRTLHHLARGDSGSAKLVVSLWIRPIAFQSLTMVRPRSR